jgi:hypothetical protein
MRRLASRRAATLAYSAAKATHRLRLPGAGRDLSEQEWRDAFGDVAYQSTC